MIGYWNATLPRRPSLQVEMRHYTCDWRGCAEEYDSPSGVKPRACPKCRATDEYRAEERDRQRAARLRSEARRGKR